MVSSEQHGPVWDEISRERASSVLDMAFVAAQLGMPSEDHETAVDSLWVILEALLVDHLAPSAEVLDDPLRRRVTIGVQWQRLVTTAVTHTFVLGGGFVEHGQLLDAVGVRATDLEAGRLWRSRRPIGHGALVLGVHDDLAVLGAGVGSAAVPGPREMAALVDLIALGVVGVLLAGPETPETTHEGSGRRTWDRTPATVAASFGIPDVSLVAVSRDGWMCDACGCLFLGRVDGKVAYPDRFAPVGREGPCDSVDTCACHAAPIQRNIR